MCISLKIFMIISYNKSYITVFYITVFLYLFTPLIEISIFHFNNFYKNVFVFKKISQNSNNSIIHLYEYVY